MGVDTNAIKVSVKKSAIFAVKALYSSLVGHPVLCAALCFGLLLCRLFPTLFAFLLSSAPVIICTALLLGTLLSFGKPKIPEIEEDSGAGQTLSALRSSRTSDHVIVEKDPSFSVEAPLGKKEENENGAINEDRKVQDELREIQLQKPSAQRLQFDTGHIEKSDVSVKQKEASAPSGNVFDGSFASSWDNNDEVERSSSSESDRAESSSPDASMTDIAPILDELHPLLDIDSQNPMLKSCEDPDHASEESGHSQESGHDSEEMIDEEIQGEETHEDNEDGIAAVMTWTEDDEKNIKDIKNLELERNRKMECLIAKRIATKHQKVMVERNLIDLDALPIQVPPVSTTRQNPFDFPHGSDESLNLQPMPGSAPSVLLPRINPFDLPYGDANEVKNAEVEEKMGQMQLPVFHQRDAYFRRHESFTLGTSFCSDMKAAKPENSRFRPYFVPAKAESEETGVSSQAFEPNISKMCSDPRAISSSYMADNGDENQSVHQEPSMKGALHPDAEKNVEENGSTPTSSPSSSSTSSSSLSGREETLDLQNDVGTNILIDEKSVDKEFQLVDSIEEKHCSGHESYTEDKLNSAESSWLFEGEIPLDPSKKKPMFHADVSMSLQKEEDWLRPGIETELVKNDAGGANSSSLEFIGDSVSTKKSIVEPLKWSSDLLQSMNTGIDQVEVQAVGPVFDSSPSAADKHLMNSTGIELAVNEKAALSGSNSASVLDTSIKVPERPVHDAYDDGGNIEGKESQGEGFWSAASNLAAVDEYESKSREVNVISELDVIQVGLSGVEHNIDNSCKPLIFEAISEEVLKLPSSSSPEELLRHSCSELSDSDGFPNNLQVNLSERLSGPELGNSPKVLQMMQETTEESLDVDIVNGSGETAENSSQKEPIIQKIKEPDQFSLSYVDNVGGTSEEIRSQNADIEEAVVTDMDTVSSSTKACGISQGDKKAIEKIMVPDEHLLTELIDIADDEESQRAYLQERINLEEQENVQDRRSPVTGQEALAPISQDLGSCISDVEVIETRPCNDVNQIFSQMQGDDHNLIPESSSVESELEKSVTSMEVPLNFAVEQTSEADGKFSGNMNLEGPHDVNHLITKSMLEAGDHAIRLPEDQKMIVVDRHDDLKLIDTQTNGEDTREMVEVFSEIQKHDASELAH